MHPCSQEESSSSTPAARVGLPEPAQHQRSRMSRCLVLALAALALAASFAPASAQDPYNKRPVPLSECRACCSPWLRSLSARAGPRVDHGTSLESRARADFTGSCLQGRFLINHLVDATKVGACGICPVGTSTMDGKRCISCAAGTYADQGGSAFCKICPAGTISAAGASGCTDCAAGTYNGKAGGTVCQTCPAGATRGRAPSLRLRASAGAFAQVASTLHASLVGVRERVFSRRLLLGCGRVGLHGVRCWHHRRKLRSHRVRQLRHQLVCALHGRLGLQVRTTPRCTSGGAGAASPRPQAPARSPQALTQNPRERVCICAGPATGATWPPQAPARARRAPPGSTATAPSPRAPTAWRAPTRAQRGRPPARSVPRAPTRQRAPPRAPTAPWARPRSPAPRPAPPAPRVRHTLGCSARVCT